MITTPNNMVVNGTSHYRTCMASAEICDKYKASLSKVDEFTCYTHAQSCNIESCIASITIQLPKVDQNIVVTA